MPSSIYRRWLPARLISSLWHFWEHRDCQFSARLAAQPPARHLSASVSHPEHFAITKTVCCNRICCYGHIRYRLYLLTDAHFHHTVLCFWQTWLSSPDFLSFLFHFLIYLFVYFLCFPNLLFLHVLFLFNTIKVTFFNFRFFGNSLEHETLIFKIMGLSSTSSAKPSYWGCTS